MISNNQYNQFILDYTSEIRKAFDLSYKMHSSEKIFNLNKMDYILDISRNLIEYDQNIIMAAILYNPYLKNLDLKKNNFNKNIRKICKDLYFLNLFNLLNNYDIKEEDIKEYLVQTFYKTESIIITFAEILSLLNYFNKIKDKKFKERLLKIVDTSILPLAYQLGIYNLKDKLLDSLILIKEPKQFKNMKKYLLTNFPKENLNLFKEIVTDFLKSKNLKPLFYEYRYKSVGSFYQKVYINRLVPISEVSDVYALRLIFENKKDCYNVFNLLKENFLLHNNKVFDFIKHPKENGYQSIHLKIKIDNFPIEIQIRTIDMHNNATYGLSSHFHYKNISNLSSKESKILKYLKKQTSVNVNKSKEYKDYINVFTVTNEKIIMPKKSTLFDFAFFLHTTFVKYFDYAIINNQIIKDKGYLLKNGDKIKIIKSKKITFEFNDKKYVFVNKNKRKFNLVANKVYNLLNEPKLI